MAQPYSRRGFLRASLAATAGAWGLGAEAPASAPAEPAPPEPPEPAPGWAETVELSTSVNGETRALTVLPDESALDAVRGRLGLTGAKRACGHGACGACTIQVNEIPVSSCLLPAVALDGARVRTVEGIGAVALHPVQRAFLAEDALQCGFCTPGFVVEAAAFHDRWRAARGAASPSREEIAAALAGHLCRCGAYENIYRAVAAACRGEHDGADPRSPRVEAREKVTGAALYAGDVTLPGLLEGRVLRAWRAPGKVLRVDSARAAALPGVRAVHHHVAPGATLRYAGQELVSVAAVDLRTAQAALALVELSVDYSAPAVGLDAARRPDAPHVYPEPPASGVAPSANEGPVFAAKWAGNVRGPVSSSFFASPRAAAEALAGLADRGDGTLVEQTWRTQHQCHTAMEPHTTVAIWTDERHLTVHQSTQACQLLAEDIAERFELPEANVRVLAAHVGGGFGAKVGADSTTITAITLSKLAGAPVRVALDRAEELAVGGNRPAHEITLAIGMDAAGQLVGLRSVSWGDGGVAVGNNASLLMRLLYPQGSKELLDYDVTTHAAPAKPFRGPGGPPGLWALEQSVDELALRRGEDPVTLRRRIDPNPVRGRLYDQVERLPLWTEREVGEDKGRHRLGVGLAAASWLYLVDVLTQVHLKGEADGQIVASCACQDMGQGSRTVLATAVADAMGLEPNGVTLRWGDSSLPRGPMSGGSRTTASLVVAAEDAARQLQEALLDAARALGMEDAELAPGGVRSGGELLPWAALLKRTGRVEATGRRRRDEGGYFLPLRIDGMAVGRALGGGLVVVQVEVDTRLGRVRPRAAWGGFGVGRLIAPALAENQARGGVIQGLSYALYEERHLDPRHASLLSAGLEDYRLMGIGDAPEIALHFDVQGFEQTRMGGVGLGELVTVGVAAAVGNAVRHATGWRPTHLPLRPDRVLAGLRA